MDEQSFETIQWSFYEETGVGAIVLDRPDAQNAISNQMQVEFVAGIKAFEEIDHRARDTDDGVSVQVLTVEGAGSESFSVEGENQRVRRGQSRRVRPQRGLRRRRAILGTSRRENRRVLSGWRSGTCPVV